jgi:hypothetical protein
MLRCYLDNDVASTLNKSHNETRDKKEIDAVNQLKEWDKAKKIRLGTSRQSLREMERAPAQYQGDLKTGIATLDIAQDDHKVLGFFDLSDRYGGYICNPIVTDIVDEPLYSQLQKVGLKPDDAKHFMYAVHNSYERFVTWDKNFLNRRAELLKLRPSIQIQKPSELVDELLPHSETGQKLTAAGD